MNPAVALCPHLASLELAALPIAPADILEWRDSPVVAIARCAQCERLGLLELVEWDRRAGVRTYTLAGLDPAPLATFLHDLARGSCDPSRLAKEGESLLAAAGPVERIVSLAAADGAVLRIERAGHGRLEQKMSVSWGAGFHAPAGQSVDASAYGRYVGRWSRLFVPALLAAAEVRKGDRVLDVATGPGEAALEALSVVGEAGLVIGADISAAMLEPARARLSGESFWAAAMDGQALAFPEASFDAVLCQLGLMFFRDPGRGLSEFRRVLRPGRRAAACVISSPDRAPMWGILAETLSRHLPDQRQTLHLSFALGDSAHLEEIFSAAGFRDVVVKREVREGIVESFEEYWAPIEAGIGLMPQAYLALPEPTRRAVREEVRARLSQFESNGRLVMSVEMLIGAGRA